jgi:hypothetical protein
VVCFFSVGFVGGSGLGCSVDVLQGVAIGLENKLNML